ncbi:uncharacterized protein [Asterias amurensis]|uniref:uncharacterized protein isoform X1 n=1 Tax=Asterias amurensis TaxID=7602 RepID=UPI003AB17771
MAQPNWNGYGNGYPHQQRRMNAHVIQTEGERLYDQALAFCASGDFTQVEQLLNKAIALEPSNVTFQEARNILLAPSHRPSTHSQRQPGVPGNVHKAQAHKKKDGRDPRIANQPKATWDDRNFQGPAEYGNLQRSSKSPWLSSVNTNTAQYHSDAVADNMFGSGSWQGPIGAVNNPDPATKNCFGDHKYSNSAAGSSAGQTLKQEWSDWSDPGLTVYNSTIKPSWFQHTDNPWMDERRKVPSAPKPTNPLNCSASQNSLRGSNANSTERTSIKDPPNRTEQSSPQTWQSEETSSDAMNALDSFDDPSVKVQEWLNSNESSGDKVPPGFKPKKNRKKKKKTAAATKKTPPAGSRTSADHEMVDKPTSGYQGKENKTIEKTTILQYQEQVEKQKPPPNLATNKASRKNSNPQAHSVKKDDKPKEAMSAKVADKQFFDPRRIFNSSETTKSFKSPEATDKKECVNVDSKRTETVDSGSKSKGVQNNHVTTGPTKTSRVKHASENTREIPSQKMETQTPAKEDKQGSPERGYSSSDERMTEAEWRDIIKRMYVPLGISPDTSPESSSKTESPPKTTANGMCNKTSVQTDHCTMSTNERSEIETSVGKSTSSLVNSESLNAARTENARPDSQTYINVKDILKDGNLKTKVPVCRAHDSIVSNSSPSDSLSGCLGRDTPLTLNSSKQPKFSLRCQESLAKPSISSTPAQGNPSEDKNNCPGVTQCVAPEPKVISPPSLSTIAPKANESRLETSLKGCVESKETNTSSIRSDKVLQDKKPSKQSAKAFWEPTRIFSNPGKVGEHKNTETKPAVSQTSAKPTTKLTSDTKTCLESSQQDCSAPKRTPEPYINKEQSIPLNIAGSTQSKDVPLNPNMGYSYTDWKKQNATSSMVDSNTPEAAATSQKGSFSNSQSSTGSKTEQPSEFQPHKDPARGTATRKKSTSNNSEVLKGTTPKPPSRDASKSQEAKQSASSSATSQPPSSRNFTSSNAQGSSSNHSTSFFRQSPNDRRQENPSKTAPNQSDEKQKGPTRSEPKTKQKAAPEARRKPTETNSAHASQSRSEKQSTNTNSKATGEHARPQPSTGYRTAPQASQSRSEKQSTNTNSKATGEHARPQPSTGYRTAPQASRSRTSSRMTDSDSEYRQRTDQQEEINIEDVDPLYKWMRGIGKHLLWVLGFILLLTLILCACLCSMIKLCLKYGWHILQEIYKLFREHREREGGSRGNEGPTGGPRAWGSSNSPSSAQPPSQPTRSIDIPTSAGAAIKRLLQCDPDNPFEVLGVSSDASEEDIKKYYRRQCMLVHPDKNDQEHKSRKAFQILQKGYETLTDPVKRREFEMERKNVNFSEEMEDFMKKMEEILNTLSCEACHGKHRRYETDRVQDHARYCSVHGERHSANEHDMWAETSHLGFKVHFYAMMEDRIFDITEWAACQKKHGFMGGIEANTCEIRYRLGSNSRTNRGGSRSRSQQSNPPNFCNHHSNHRSQEHEPDFSEEQLRDLFERLHRNDIGQQSGDRYNNANQDRNKRHKKNKKKKR